LTPKFRKGNVVTVTTLRYFAANESMRQRETAMPTARRRSTRVAADIDGTFADGAVLDQSSGAAIRLGKTLSPPGRLIGGIESGVGCAEGCVNW
jgi:hypothetical protein